MFNEIKRLIDNKTIETYLAHDTQTIHLRSKLQQTRLEKTRN